MTESDIAAVRAALNAAEEAAKWCRGWANGWWFDTMRNFTEAAALKNGMLELAAKFDGLLPAAREAMERLGNTGSRGSCATQTEQGSKPHGSRFEQPHAPREGDQPDWEELCKEEAHLRDKAESRPAHQRRPPYHCRAGTSDGN